MNKIKQAAILEAWVTIVLVSGLTACTSGSGDDDKPKITEIVTTAPTITPAAASPTGPLEYGLKDVAKWGDITVKLSNFHRSRTTDAGVPEDTNYVAFTVTATNDSDDPLNLDDLTIACIRPEVFDGTKELSGTPEVHAMPNRSVSWNVACAQDKDKKYLQVEVEPQRDGDRTAIFSGTIE